MKTCKKLIGTGWRRGSASKLVLYLVWLQVVMMAAALHAQVFSDDFTRGSDPGPLTPWIAVPDGVSLSDDWEVTGGQMRGGTGSVPPNNYSFAYITNTWANFSVQAQIQFSISNAYGGGIGGRLNTTNGAHYAAWVYPDGSPGGSNVVELIKFQTFTTFGYTNVSFSPMAVASLPSVGTNAHTVKLSFVGNQITVYFDGTVMINTTDVEASPYSTGAISLDMWTASTNYYFYVDNVQVYLTASTPVAVNDTYNATQGLPLTVAAPGVLANDTGGSGPLHAVLLSNPAHGNLNFSTNGGFTYNATNNFIGTDSFTYQASDGVTNSTTATVTINVAADQPPVANNDSYTMLANNSLVVPAPGVLANDTDTDGNPLTAVLGSGPVNGTLNLTNNGGFTYTPNAGFSGADSFTYVANDGLSNSATATVSLNVLPAGTLFFDSFTRGTDPGPLAPWVGVPAGSQLSDTWTVTGGALVAGLADSTQTYSVAYMPTNTWTNYSVQANIQLSSTNGWGGGIGGRMNTGTGAGYAAWIYPGGSPGGSNVLKLLKFSNFTTYGYNNVSYTGMQTVSVPPVGTNAHALKLAFNGTQLAAYLDGTQVISMTDGEVTTYPSGAISVSRWTDFVNYNFSVRNVIVSSLVNADGYAANSAIPLSVPAPGVLANDTEVYGTNLTASLVSGPAFGTLTLTNNGGFTYAATNGFTGVDSFTYQANDGTNNLGTATVTLTVTSGGYQFFSQNFDSVTTPALPAGWTTTATGGETAWVTEGTNRDTAPNAAFVIDGQSTGNSELVSPAIALPAGPNQLAFRNSYNLEFEASNTNLGYDGGVLEIKIGTNAFVDIIAAGGAFLGGAYNRTISTLWQSPIAGRPAWSGNSGGFITTTVDLPASASGQNVQLKWRCASDLSGVAPGNPGWWIDTISILNCANSTCWNTPPVFPVQTNQTVNELTLLTVTNAATDTDVPAQTLTYSLLNPPTGAVINATNGVITWTPAEGQGPGNYTLATRVLDNGSPPLSATNSFTVVVAEVNFPPVLPAQTNRTINGLVTLTVTNTATDQDSSASFAYALQTAPTNAAISTNGVITWTPVAAQVPGTYAMTTVVTDTDSTASNTVHLSATNTFSVTVNTLHNGPSLPAQTNRTVNEFSLLTVSNKASDVDAPVLTLTYALVTGPTNAVIDTNGTITWTPVEGQGPGTNLITTVVTDNGTPNLSSTNSFTVVVNDINVPPVLPAQTNRTIVGLAPLIVTNTATDSNIPAATLSYGLLFGPTNAAISTNGVISWTPVAAQVPSTNTFTTVVTNFNPVAVNSQHLTATNTFTVTVNAVHNPPVLPAQTNVTVNEFALLTVTNTASESDIPALALGYQLVSPPAGAGIDTNGVITWTPAEGQGPSTNVITTVVTDSGTPALSATNSFTVVVNDINVPPVLPAQTNRTIVGLSPLVVTNTASDSNIPVATLSYGLVTGPTNATISTNGVISWTPVPAQVPGTNTFTTVVTNFNPYAVNAQQLTATNSFTVTVNAVHNGPSLPAQTNVTVNEMALLTVTNTASDSDVPAPALNYQLVSPPTGASIDTNGVITWTPAEGQGPSTNVITTVVTDNGTPNLSSTNSFTVVVNDINVPPVLPAQTNRTIVGLSPLVVTNTASDPNIPATTLSYGLVTGPTNATISTNGVISWTPVVAQVPSTNVFTTIVTNFDPVAVNSQHLTATNTFTVTVNAVHNPPVLPAQTNVTVNEFALLTVTNTASESDIPALALNYSLVSPPAGAGIDTNGVITWTPAEGQGPSTNVITTVVTDSGTPALSSTNSFTVVVNDINVPPVLPAQTNRTIAGLSPVVVTNTASDSNIPAATLSYGLVTGPTNATISTNGVISWTPVPAQVPGTNTFTTVVTNFNPFAVNSQHLTATNTFTVTVNAIHNGPSLPAQTNVTVNEQTLLTVTNTATDSDIPATSLTYQLVNPPAGAGIDTNGVITWTPDESQGPGTNVITTVVTDNGTPALSATNSFTVVVNEVNVPPVLPAQTNRTIVGTATLVVTNTATDPDIPANPLTYVLQTGPTNAAIDTNGVITWTPVPAQVPSTNTFTTVVTDFDQYAVNSQHLSATNTFTVTVNAIHNGPSLPAQTNHTVNALVLLTVTNTATSSDIPTLGMNYSLVSPPAGAAIDTNGVITWTPASGQAGTTNVITTVVTDTGTPALSATNSFLVVVNSGAPPPAPMIMSLTISNDVASVTWTSVSGKSYVLQYKDDAAGTNWTQYPPVIATGSTTTATNSLGAATQRFYRIAQVPGS